MKVSTINQTRRAKESDEWTKESKELRHPVMI